MEPPHMACTMFARVNAESKVGLVTNSYILTFEGHYYMEQRLPYYTDDTDISRNTGYRDRN